MTLYEEINALGGVVDQNDERSIGRMENLDAVLAIIRKRQLAPSDTYQVIPSEQFLAECEDESADLLDALADCDNLVLFNGTQADGWWEVRRGSMTGEIRGRGPTPRDALRAALATPAAAPNGNADAEDAA